MPRTHARFTLLVIFTLVIGVIRCMADCTAVTCNPAGTRQMPPCHHHHQAPGQDTSVPCAPDVVLPGTAQTHAPQISVGTPTPALAAPMMTGVRFTTAGSLSVSLNPSHPKSSLKSSIVLRI
jgi:hypothetical protein